MVLTPIRHLEGISYWVIGDSSEITKFLRTVLKKEWEADYEDDGWPSKEWLTDLLGRSWSLKVIDIEGVHGHDYMKSERLAERRKELKRGIERYGHVIWPIVVKEEDHYLADGYCRLTTLKEMGIKKIYAYVGSHLRAEIR